jgi:hypothetical protein
LRDVADQLAARAVAGNDVVRVVPTALESHLAVVEVEMAFGFLRAVTAQAAVFENGQNVAIEIDRDICRRRQRRCGTLRMNGERRGKEECD